MIKKIILLKSNNLNIKEISNNYKLKELFNNIEY
jgi:hypothetical protein